MAHPHIHEALARGVVFVGETVEQGAGLQRPHLRVTTGVSSSAHFCVAELTRMAAFNLAAQLLRHGLHAVADAEHRHAELEHGRRRLVGRLLVGRHVAAREDHADGLEGAHELVANVGGMHFAVNAGLAHTPRDQLRHLRTEIENQDGLVSHVVLGVSGYYSL